MSTIPTSAMPHARVDQPGSDRSSKLSEKIAQGRRWAAERYDGAARTVTDHPRIALGAVASALLAIAAAALAPRLLRQRSALSF